MFDTDKFADCGKIALRYRELLSMQETSQIALWKFVSGEKREDGTYTPIFLSGAEGPLNAIAEAEEKISALEKYAEEFSKLMGEFRSIRELSDALHRAKNAISLYERDARATYERELKNHRELSADQVRGLDVVRNAGLKADKTFADMTPVVIALQERLQAAHNILEKF